MTHTFGLNVLTYKNRKTVIDQIHVVFFLTNVHNKQIILKVTVSQKLNGKVVDFVNVQKDFISVWY